MYWKKPGIPCGITSLLSASCARFVFFLFFLVSIFPLSPVLHAQTELGSEDDLTVLGVNGTADDPDAEIKGFTVFGSTQAAYTGAAAGAGNVVVNGRLAVSSGAYFVGGSTFAAGGAYFAGVSSFSNVTDIHVAGGTANQVLKKVAGGGMAWDDVSAMVAGDNLGSHIATTTLNMNSWDLVAVSSVNFKSGVFISSAAAAQGGGVYVSTNLFIVGFSSAAKYYGDGASLTGISAADNTKVAKAGDTMTGQLTLSGSTLTIIAPTSSASSLWVSTSATIPHLYVSSTGNVGIGTTGPSIKLNVAGTNAGLGVTNTGGVAGVAGGAGNINYLSFAPSFSNSGAYSYQNLRLTGTFTNNDTGAATVYGLYVDPSSAGTGPTTVYPAVFMNGNVGIGTTGPSYRLHIPSLGAGTDTALIGGLKISVGGAGEPIFDDISAHGGIGFLDPINVSNDHAFSFTSNSGGGGGYRWRMGTLTDGSGKYRIEQYGDNWVSEGIRLTINRTGDVGIGTTGPLSRFDVADGSITVRGTNAGLVLENASRVISPETSAALGAGIRVSTNIYIVGFSSAAKYYGDGSSLTGLTGDNLGSHVATTTLNMSSWDLVAVSSVNFKSGVFISSAAAAQGGGVYVSTNLFIVGFSSAAGYYGNGAALANVTTSYVLGQSFGGGKIFWIDPSGKQVLISATADQSGAIAWSKNDNRTGANLDGIYAGKANTVTISTMQGSGSYAAQLCSDYGVTVNNEYYDDWYLPSKYEAHLLYAQKNVVGGFADVLYHTANEYTPNPARCWAVYFGNDSETDNNKASNSALRCIRAGPSTSIGNSPNLLIGTQTFTGANMFQMGVTASSFTATGIGFAGEQLKLANNVFISSETSATLGGGVRVSTNVYIVGFSSAIKYYGDGSGLTNLVGAADNLGNHTATQNLNISNYRIINVSTIVPLGNSIMINPYPQGLNYNYGISIGSGAYNNYDEGIGVGRDAKDNYLRAVGVGYNAYNNYTYGVGVGYGAYNNYTAGVGVGSGARDNYSYGVGVGRDATLNNTYGVGVGYLAYQNYNYGVGVGANSANNFNYGTGVGAYTSSKSSSVALGSFATANQVDSVALGAGSKANAKRSVAIGAYTINNDTDTVKLREDYTLKLDSINVSGTVPQLTISTNVFIIGYSSATKYYGDGSNLTGLAGAGDNLGNHTAIQALQMGAYGVNTSSNITAARYQINGSTVVAILTGGSLGIGVNAGRVSTGDKNVFVGPAAGYSDTIGNYNSFLGFNAGYSNTTGDWNSFLGYQAGYNTTGDKNAFFGYNAGFANTSGDNNSFFGASAGYDNTGINNSFLGYGAGYSNTTGGNNSYLGASAGYYSTTGENNSYLGASAGYYNRKGSANSILGNQAGYGVSANSFSSSTLVGYQAGYGLSTGSDNIFLGWQAGYAVTTGTGNIIIGYNKGASAPAANNELNIGGVLYGDLSAKTIGISTRAPQAALDIVSTGTLISQYAQIWRASDGTIVSSMTATGVLYPQSAPAGDNLGNHTATTNLSMAGFDIINASSITVATAKPGLTISTNLYVMNGNVGIGTANPIYALDVNGTIRVPADLGNAGIRFGSDLLVSGQSGQGVLYLQPIGNGNQSAIHLLPTSGTWPTDTLNELVLNRTSGPFGGDYERLSLTNIGSDSGNIFALHQETGPSSTVRPVLFSLGHEASVGVFTSYEYFRLMDGTNLGNTAFGLSAPHSREVLQLQVLDIGSSGTRDSHSILWRGKANDGGEHAVDWRQYVDVTSNAGASTFIIQNRVDGAAFVDKLAVMSAGYVGIGTAGPATKLEVSAGDLRMSSGYTLQWGGTNNRISGDETTDYLQFVTNGSEAMRIISSGNAGIGTTAPTSKLYIQTDTAYSGNEVAAHGINIGTGLAADDHYLYMGADKTNGLSYIQSVGNQDYKPLVLQGRGGSVGIGTAGPLSKFDVFDGSITVRGTNAGLVLENANRVISPETSAALGAGIKVSTNVYIVGFSSAAKYYGDGSSLTGLTGAGDNLGNHTASTDLTMTGYNVTDARYITASSAALSGQLIVYGTSTLAGAARFNGPLISTGNAQIAKYTVQAADTGITLTSADFGKTITVNSASAQTINLPSVTAADIGATITVVKLGVGKVTIQAAASTYIGSSTSGGTIYNTAVSPAYATITLRLVTATQWMLVGGDGAWIST